MSKGLMIGLVVGGLVVVGVGSWFLYNKQAASSQEMVGVLDEQDKTADSVTTLRGLIGLGVNQTCSFSGDAGNTGTVFLGSGQVRGDFQSTIDGQVQTTHMISDGETVYLWFDGQTEGITTSLQSSSEMSLEADSTDSAKTVDLDKKVDYNCTPWTIDASKFELPAGINFNDFSQIGAMVEGEGLINETDQSSQCSTCDVLPEAARVQCRQALNCIQ